MAKLFKTKTSGALAEGRMSLGHDYENEFLIRVPLPTDKQPSKVKRNLEYEHQYITMIDRNEAERLFLEIARFIVHSPAEGFSGTDRDTVLKALEEVTKGGDYRSTKI